MDLFLQRLQYLQRDDHSGALRGIRRGIEKESLRVTPQGTMAQTPHPAALGSALKHPYITTDFSEALLEFITPVCDSIDGTLGWLDRIHAYTYSVLEVQKETLWAASMPCALEGDDAIPLAQYGTSNTAKMKTTYREGLGHRYGRLMQTIAGIHYNVSFPDALWLILQQQDGTTGSLQDFKTQRYFDVIRNFRRYLWLLLYLFGASPAVCPTFVKGRNHQLQSFDDKNNSMHLPFATSLRMGDLGYQSNAQSSLIVCYNSLASYIETLKRGLTESYPAYEKIGVRDIDGHYRQLSTNLLQIENEFYSTIRPKRVTTSGETPILALHERGVEYIEVRCLDLNPFLPAGIDSDTAHFVEAFLLWCLLQDSPATDQAEHSRLLRNQKLAVERGRDPSMLLDSVNGPRGIQEWGLSFIDEIAACAQLLDAAHESTSYGASINVQRARLHDRALTPSAVVLDKMKAEEQSFFRLSRELSEHHAAFFLRQELPAAQSGFFIEEARESLQRQKSLESHVSSVSFEQYLQNYYSQYARV
jgi:glutamate--cysteine ligase